MSDASSSHFVRRLISGGQTGVDRGALRAAISLGLEHGGWCPRGRRAEDGVIPRRFELTETQSSKYWVRTERNVVDSDGTLIVTNGELSGGTELTYRLTRKHGRPCLVADVHDAAAAATVRQWLVSQRIETLNVAGPRESSVPGIANDAEQFLVRVLRGVEPSA